MISDSEKSGAERNDRRMWVIHAGFIAEEIVPTVPAPVLARAALVLETV